MTNPDTADLLEQCTVGSRKAVEKIDGMLPHVRDRKLGQFLTQNRKQHHQLEAQLVRQLAAAGRTAPDPSPMAQLISRAQMGVRMALDPTDHQAASILLDGCNTEVKVITERMNRCQSAEPKARQAAQKLVQVEEQMAQGLRAFL